MEELDRRKPIGERSVDFLTHSHSTDALGCEKSFEVLEFQMLIAGSGFLLSLQTPPIHELMKSNKHEIFEG